MEIARLRADHVAKDFDSGVAALDRYLKRFAWVNERRGISRTYVATDGEDPSIRGFVTVLVGAVACGDVPEDERKALPRYPVPVLHIGRLAVDRSASGNGLGERLLLHALGIALGISEQAGLRGVEVIAEDDGAKSFSEKCGFKSLADDELRLYLSLKTIRSAFG